MSFNEIAQGPSLRLPNGCHVAHGSGTNVKKPFSNIPVVMHELDAGGLPRESRSYCGQLGFIMFDETLRLPRHVHIGTSRQPSALVTERIIVLGGVALVELNGSVYVIAPGSLVTISPGVPHTWAVCPAGFSLPDGEISDGKFLMVYEYEEPTGFFPTKGTKTLQSVNEYERYGGDLEDIRFPKMTKEEVVERAKLIWNQEVLTL
ncbi:hypothetical protein B7463_g12488, partial [Scytalidium lignicola]